MSSKLGTAQPQLVLIWYLELNDKEHGNAYFEAAINSGYTKMILIENNFYGKAHPKIGSFDTENLYEKFNPDTGKIDLGQNGWSRPLKTVGAAWIFCLPRIHPLRPLADGETMEFIIDAEQYKECQKQRFKVTKKHNQITGTASFSIKASVLFIAGTEVFKEVSSAKCQVGKISFVVDSKFGNCGLAALLTKLCLIDEDLTGYGNVLELGEENIGLSTMKDILEKMDDKKGRLIWIQSACKNFWTLFLNEKISEVSEELFDAAVDAGYTRMMMLDSNDKLHPSDKAAKTQTWKEKYDPEAMEIKTVIPVHTIPGSSWSTKNSHWFFCEPFQF